MNDLLIGLVLVSNDISKDIGSKIIELRSKKSTPLVFELLTFGSRRES